MSESKSVRMWVRANDDMKAELREEGEKYGVTRAQLAGFCLYLGFGMYKRMMIDSEFLAVEMVNYDSEKGFVTVEKQKGNATAN